MIAKLFDRISIQSLVYSYSLSILVLISAFWLPPSDVTFAFLNQNLVIPANFAWPVASLCTFFSGLVLNEVLNKQRMFYGNYHVLPIFCAVAIALFSGNQEIKASFSLLVLLVFYLKVYRLIFQSDSKYHYFEIGLVAGLFSFWFADFLILLPISWLTGLVLGKLNFRSIISNVIGAVASIYLVIALVGFFKINLWKNWVGELSKLTFSFSFNLTNQWAFIPLGAILLLVFFQLPQLNNRGNNMQRQAVALWYVLLILALAGFVFFENKAFYLGLLLFPFGRLAALFVSSNTNFWLRNSIYLLLFASVALVLLKGSGLLLFG